MNTYRLKHLIFGCLCLLILAIFALSLGAESSSAGADDQFIHLPIIVAPEEETGGTIPTRTPIP